MNARQIVLAARPKGMPTVETFRTEEITLPDLQNEEVLLKGLYYSVDPYMRGRMSAAKSYAAPYEVDQPIHGGIVAEVVQSTSPEFAKGDVVLGYLPWSTTIIAKAKDLKK